MHSAGFRTNVFKENIDFYFNHIAQRQGVKYYWRFTDNDISSFVKRLGFTGECIDPLDKCNNVVAWNIICAAQKRNDIVFFGYNTGQTF